MTWAPHDMLSSLAGEWRIRRSIEEIASSAPMAELEGIARITPSGRSEAAYVEEGLLSLPGRPPVGARRAYHYRQRADGIDIFFDAAGTRIFHRLELRDGGDGGLAATDLHLCATDRYESVYRFLADGRFTIEHTVTGPRKSYRSRTDYRRA